MIIMYMQFLEEITKKRRIIYNRSTLSERRRGSVSFQCVSIAPGPQYLLAVDEEKVIERLGGYLPFGGERKITVKNRGRPRNKAVTAPQIQIE